MVHTFAGALGLSACLLCQDAVEGAAQRAPDRAGENPVVVMPGTGTPRPTPEVWGPATAVVVAARVFLVDAGVGVERRLALQLGELAARPRPKLLVAYHNGRPVADDRILADIRRSFPGPVTIAADLQRF